MASRYSRTSIEKGFYGIVWGVLKVHGFTITARRKAVIEEIIRQPAQNLYKELASKSAERRDRIARERSYAVFVAASWVAEGLEQSEVVSAEDVRHLIHENMERRTLNESVEVGLRRLYPKTGQRDNW
jgi:hypothetical protein